jgi:hypothetical protein
VFSSSFASISSALTSGVSGSKALPTTAAASASVGGSSGSGLDYRQATVLLLRLKQAEAAVAQSRLASQDLQEKLKTIETVRNFLKTRLETVESELKSTTTDRDQAMVQRIVDRKTLNYLDERLKKAEAEREEAAAAAATLRQRLDAANAALSVNAAAGAVLTTSAISAASPRAMSVAAPSVPDRFSTPPLSVAAVDTDKETDAETDVGASAPMHAFSSSSSSPSFSEDSAPTAAAFGSSAEDANAALHGGARTPLELPAKAGSTGSTAAGNGMRNAQSTGRHGPLTSLHAARSAFATSGSGQRPMFPPSPLPASGATTPWAMSPGGTAAMEASDGLSGPLSSEDVSRIFAQRRALAAEVRRLRSENEALRSLAIKSSSAVMPPPQPSS